MKYVVKKKCTRKYKHTYSEELMHRNIDEAANSIYQIESALLR